MHCMQAQLPKKRFAKSLAVLQKNLQFDKTYFGKLATDFSQKNKQNCPWFWLRKPLKDCHKKACLGNVDFDEPWKIGQIV